MDQDLGRMKLWGEGVVSWPEQQVVVICEVSVFCAEPPLERAVSA